ncbi:MAG: hypothetical protein AAFY11_05340, partial [Cyanobacteria bacterium J06641_5]
MKINNTIEESPLLRLAKFGVSAAITAGSQDARSRIAIGVLQVKGSDRLLAREILLVIEMDRSTKFWDRIAAKYAKQP